MTTTIDPTVEALAKARQAYAEVKIRLDAVETKLHDVVNGCDSALARLNKLDSTFQLYLAVLNRHPHELLHCPNRIDRLDGKVETLMADLHRREAGDQK